MGYVGQVVTSYGTSLSRRARGVGLGSERTGGLLQRVSLSTLAVVAFVSLGVPTSAETVPAKSSPSFRTVEVMLDFVDSDGGDGAWIGVSAGVRSSAPDVQDWTRIDGQRGAVRVPVDEVRLVGVARDVVPIPVTLPAGTDDESLTLSFVQGLRLAVKVVDEYQAPVRGARLSIEHGDDTVAIPEFLMSGGVSDLRGEIPLAGLEKRVYGVGVNAAGYMPRDDLTIDLSDAVPAQVVVTLREPHNITGRVVDGQSVAIPFAAVHAVRTEMSDRGDPVHALSETHVVSETADTNGNFSIGPFGLADQVDLSVQAEDGRQATESLTITPASGVTIMLNEVGVGASGLVVAAKSGLPVDGFTLVATSPTGHAARSFADANGEFRTVLPRRVSTLTIKAPGYLPWTKRISFQTSGAHHDFGRIEMQSHAKLRGRVVSRHDGAPIQSAQIAAEFGKGYRATTVSDVEGRFGLEGVPERGRVFLHVTAAGYASEVQPVDVESVVLIRLGAGGRVMGRITRPDGVPIGTGTATVYSLDRDKRLVALLDGRVDSEDDYLHRTTSLDDQGQFELAGIPIGDYGFRVKTVAGVAEPMDFEIGHDGEEVTLNVTVQPLGSLLGTIAGLATDETAGLAIWSLSPDGTEREHLKSVSRLGNGSFEVAGIPDGRFTAVLRTSRKRSLQVPFGISDSDHVEVDFDLLGEATVRGRVTLAGEPALVTVVAESVSSGQAAGVRAESRTSPEGHYIMSGLPNGRYQLDFMTWDGLGGLALDVEAFGETVIDIELPVFSVAGRIFGLPSGRNTIVRATRDSDGRERHAIVDTQGAYRFDRMPEGRYVIAVLSQRHLGGVRNVHVNDRIESFDFHLTPADTVPIRVIDPDTHKRPSSFARVACSDGPPRHDRTSTSRPGRQGSSA